MVTNDLRELSSRSRGIVFVAGSAMLIYLVIFFVNQGARHHQLEQMSRMATARETVVDMRLALSQFVLDNIRLGNRRSLPAEEERDVRKSLQLSAAKANVTLRNIESYLGSPPEDMASISAGIAEMQHIAGQRSALLDTIYNPGGLLATFLQARNDADNAFTETSEKVPLPTKDYLAAKASQNEFLAGFSATAAAEAQASLRAYHGESARFPNLASQQRKRLAATAAVYEARFEQLSAAVLDAEALRQNLQNSWAKLLPTIEATADLVTTKAADQVRQANEQSTNIEVISGILALLTALGFAALALQSYRLAMLRDERLQETTARFRDFALSTSDIFLEVDDGGRISAVDAQENHMDRLQDADVLGDTLESTMEKFNLASAVRFKLRRIFAAREPFRNFEYRIRNPQYDFDQWFSMSGIPFVDQAGQPAGMRCTLRNISLQRQAIAERELAESRLGAIIENLPLALFRLEVTRDGAQFTFVTPNAPRVMGCPLEELSVRWPGGSPPFILEEDRERVAAETASSLVATGTATGRGRVRRADGSIRWIEHIARYAAGSTATSEVRIFEGLWLDVTEEEQRLRQLQDLELAINTSDQAFFISDIKTNEISYYNAGYARVLGISTEKMVTGLKSGATGEPVGRKAEDFSAEVNAASRTPQGWRGEFAWRFKDGAVRHYLGHARALPGERRATVLTDISDRVEQEKHLLAISTAIARASDGIILFNDTVGPISYANAAIHKMFRLPEDIALEGRYLADLLPKSRDIIQRLRSRAADEVLSQGSWQTQVEGFRADETPISVHFRVTRLPDCRVLMILTDTTEQMRLEKEVQRKQNEENELRRKLADAQRLEAIGSLAGGIAHDFNNIIGAARGFADLLVADLPEGESRHYAQRIVTTCRRAAALVREIMAFARVKDGERDNIDIAPLIDEAADILVGRDGVQPVVEIQNNALGCRIVGNHTQISQVISNIVINAADATPPAGGKIVIAADRLPARSDDRLEHAEWFAPARRTPSGRIVHITTQGTLAPDRAYLRICVRDEGIGMTERVLSRLLEPFFTTKEKGRGTGLGLPVVASIIDAHDGAMRVETTPGLGTTFSVFLPMLDSQHDSRTSEPHVMPDALVDLRGHERILVVDDEVDIAESLSIALGRLGYEAAPMYDATEALEIFTEDPTAWDLIISDQAMPKIRGVQLIRKMRLLRRDIRTIICTGYSDSLTAEMSSQEGIDAFFAKPVTAETIAGTIRRIFG